MTNVDAMVDLHDAAAQHAHLMELLGEKK